MGRAVYMLDIFLNSASSNYRHRFWPNSWCLQHHASHSTVSVNVSSHFELFVFCTSAVFSSEEHVHFVTPRLTMVFPGHLGATVFPPYTSPTPHWPTVSGSNTRFSTADVCIGLQSRIMLGFTSYLVCTTCTTCFLDRL